VPELGKGVDVIDNDVTASSPHSTSGQLQRLLNEVNEKFTKRLSSSQLGFSRGAAAFSTTIAS
tara:strand:- start:266 stop:454 length:189 start_codon:yes stop_codon:yes gene_type:complete